jgi:hypothetical protein
MILKLMITLIFAGAVAQKLTGKVASNWQRWGYSRPFMYGTAAAELIALALFWTPGLGIAGAAAFAIILLGALATLLRNHEGASHVAMTASTLLLVLAHAYRSTAV